MIDNIQILEHSFSIMVSKFPKNDEDYDEAYLKKKLTDILESPIICEKAKFLLTKGINKLFIFEKPSNGENLQND